jgi:hypothetical protein
MEDSRKAELLREFRSAAQDTITEWLRRWPADDGASLKATYHDDGTVVLEREDESSIESFRLHFGVAVAEVGEEPNAPTGFVLPRTWGTVPAGWFVRTPKGEWWEVFATAELEGKQEVTLRSPEGKRVGPISREIDGKVSARHGTREKALAAAIAAIETGFPDMTIVEDVPPWDE